MKVYHYPIVLFLILFTTESVLPKIPILGNVPNYRMKTLSGKKISLNDYRGSPMPYKELFFEVEQFRSSRISYLRFNIAASNEIRYYSTIPSIELVQYRDVDKIFFGSEAELILGYTPFRGLTISAGTEWSELSSQASGNWTFIGGNLEIKNDHNLALWTGKVRGGRQCSGGVCRYIPDFEGFRLSLESRF